MIIDKKLYNYRLVSFYYNYQVNIEAFKLKVTSAILHLHAVILS